VIVNRRGMVDCNCKDTGVPFGPKNGQVGPGKKAVPGGVGKSVWE